MPRLTRIYTKTGDTGMTGLGGGQRVPKDSRRVETYGTVDELNSQIGLALSLGLCERLAAELPRIQNELFDLGSDLATPAASQARHPVPTVEPRHIEHLEALIDELNDVVGPLANFLLPGGSVGRRGPPRRADGLPARRAPGDGPGTRGADRADRPALPQSPVRRPLRHGSLREPRARRSRSRCGSRGAELDGHAPGSGAASQQVGQRRRRRAA